MPPSRRRFPARIGRAQVTEGALVGQGEATPLATIQQLDPIYVNLTQSSSELLRLRQALAAGKLKTVGKDEASVSLVLEDGSPTRAPASCCFPTWRWTRARAPSRCAPMFPTRTASCCPACMCAHGWNRRSPSRPSWCRSRRSSATTAGASVMTVGADGKVAPRPIKTGSAQGDQWIVTDGLKAGEA